MARIRVEAQEGSGGWTPIPDGTYNFRIEEVKQGQASSGTASFGCVCEVASGPATGKRSTFWFYLTPKSGWRTRELLEATGAPYVADEKTENGDVLDFDTDDLIGRAFDAQIKIEEYEGKQSNKIVKFIGLAKREKPATSTSTPTNGGPPPVTRSAATPPKGAPPPRR